MALFFYKEKNKDIRAAAYLRLSMWNICRGSKILNRKPERTDPAVYFPQRESAKSACDGFCG